MLLNSQLFLFCGSDWPDDMKSKQFAVVLLKSELFVLLGRDVSVS